MTQTFPTDLVTRLAPTPSGYLHLGNGLSFVLTWVLAKAQGGKVLLRIDDLDRQRYRPAYLEDIFRTIDWLGLDYDLGPSGPDEFEAKYSQRHRMALYGEYLDRLRQADLLYACTCSRKRVRETSIDGLLYDGHCREALHALDTGLVAWRIQLPGQAEVQIREWRENSSLILDLNSGMGDFVVRKKDQFPAYQLASLVDDSHWNINFVVRGKDLLWSTAAQLWLAQQLHLESFQNTLFWHHNLILDEQGEKLSKSEGASALKTWREQGKNPEKIFRLAAKMLELPEETYPSASTLIHALKDKLYET
ncbi:MAG: glutamate--tRNA ligase [Cyanothece sp. SIO1E1]|nr:glutamate--tRNA ligase [Cyanothece sp. SIO1E1]